jgi:DnaJ-class molecular chaperone
MISESMAREACEKLMLVWGEAWGEDGIAAAYRRLAKSAHPDAGGDAAEFVALDRAKCILLQWLKTKPRKIEVLMKEDCPNCKGKGRVVIRKRFGSMTITCGRCYGTGDANYDMDIQDT